MKDAYIVKIKNICMIALPILVLIAAGFIIAYIFSINNVVNSTKSSISTSIMASTSSLTESIDLSPSNCKLNEALPDLFFTNSSGNKVTLKSMLGKTVVLTFWASYCPYCQNELKNADGIQSMLANHSDVEYFLIDKTDMEKETKDTALTYLKKNDITLNNLFDLKLSDYNKLGIKSIPTTLVIDKKGVLRVVYTSDDLDAGKLESMINYADNGGAAGLYNFIKNNLTDINGGIKTNYIATSTTIPSGTDVLSESQGLIMDYAVKSDNKSLFEQTYNYVEKYMLKKPLAAWVITKQGPSDVNAAVDDLRIYKALSDARILWGDYSNKQLSDYANAIYTYNTDNQKLVNYYDFKSKKKSTQLNLSYADFEAIQLLEKTNSNWETVYQNSLNIVNTGFISDKFPLYYSSYDYKTKIFSQQNINMAEEMETLLHLAEVGKLPQATVEWLQNAVEGNGIFAEYSVGGDVVSGYNYESTAVYGLVSLIGDTIGNKALANDALIRMEKMCIFDTSIKLDGAFGNIDGTGIYSFDQCVALLAFENTGN